MSTALVWVDPADRFEALTRYRMLLAGQAIERARASLLELAPVIQQTARRFAALFPAPPAKYTAPQAHYGVRRVTARQYRAWKRREGRR